MGVDGGEYSLCRKPGVGFGGHVYRAGFLCETALGDFRVGDAIKNGTRQSRAPLRAVAGTRALANRSCTFYRQDHRRDQRRQLPVPLQFLPDRDLVPYAMGIYPKDSYPEEKTHNHAKYIYAP